MNDPKSIYPVGIAQSLIIAAIVLSFVDLLFLNDVIGRVLDLGMVESMIIACALGLVGIGIMAHQGIRIAHERPNAWSTIGHYTLWILLGLAFATIRLFSATILQLGEEASDEGILSILGLDVRESDIVIAPLMMLLYLATGLMAKDGFKHLLINPDYRKTREEKRLAKLQKKQKDAERATAAEAAHQKHKEEARANEIKAEDENKRAVKKKDLTKAYVRAQKNYTKRLNKIKAEYQDISKAISFVSNIDKQEKQFEETIKPNLLNIIDGSIDASQNSVALSVRAKSGQDIKQLRDAIADYNSKRA